MQKRTPALVLAAFIATFAFIGTYGSWYRAQLTHAECVGKIYGTQGCPLKKISMSCGDGHIDAGEECDNGSSRNGTGNCSAECQFLACGDGVVSPHLGEQCEPTREEVYAIDPDTNLLTTELRFTQASCGATCTAPSCAENGMCSGGCERSFKSVCDSSSVSSASPSETVIAEASSSSDAVVIVASSVCGNGAREAGEQCDDGNTIEIDDCTASCKLARCGDGSVQREEACDDGNKVDTDACTNRCTAPACGDGIVQGGETCDRGGNNSDHLANACRTDCSIPRCGDRVVDNGEECDGGDACTVDCVRVKSVLALLADTSGAGKAAIGLSLVGGFLVLVFLFRVILHRVVRHVAGEQIARSLDDIPLDQIEMPWLK